MIRANAARYPISARCGMPGVPCSTCYWMIGRPGTERVDPVAGDVRAVRRDSRERYGVRKIKAALERRGVTASRRRIGGIMREQGMTGAYTRRRFKPRKTRADEARPANLLDRGFDGYAPHTRPAGDLTSVRVGGGWAYVCLLAGLADRGIAGHSAGRPRDAGLVLAAFAALDFSLTDVQVFHADRGGGFDDTGIDEPLDVVRRQRIAVAQGQLLRQRRGRVDEQAAEEGARVPEPPHHDRAAEARPRRLRWWSDDRRLHSTLGYRSPKEFTEQGLVL